MVDGWFCQVDGLAEETTLVVILANNWMKSIEHPVTSKKDSQLAP